MLLNVYDGVVADFQRSGCPAKVLFGHRFLAENADASRVVFVPSSDPGFNAPNPSVITSVPYQARSMMTRPAGCEIHIWGAGPVSHGEQVRVDYAACDALINQTAMSLHRTAAGVFRILGGKFTQGPDHVRRGFEYVMRILVDIPILDIDFPCGCIDTGVRTWDLQDDVRANITAEMRESLPTGPLMSSTNFIVEGES